MLPCWICRHLQPVHEATGGSQGVSAGCREAMLLRKSSQARIHRAADLNGKGNFMRALLLSVQDINSALQHMHTLNGKMRRICHHGGSQCIL